MYEFYTFRFNTLFVSCKRTREGSFLNVTECLVRDMASVSSHTGSATVTNRTNNDSDVVLGDRRQFKTQRSDHLKTWSYIMIVPHVTPLHVPIMLNRCKIRISSWPR